MVAARAAVTEAVQRDLAALGDDDLGNGALAAAALELAAQLDDPSNSATSKSMCARALADVLERLRELAPARERVSPLSEIRARRDARLRRAK